MKIVKLADIIPKKIVVEIAEGQGIELGVVTLEQIAKLYWTYQDTFLSLYATGSGDEPNYTTIVMAAPTMVAQIIAYAAGEEDSVEAIKTLPPTVQLIALSEVWKLSVPDPKKLKEALTSLMSEIQKISQPAVSLETPDKNTETTLKTA